MGIIDVLEWTDHSEAYNTETPSTVKLIVIVELRILFV